MSNLCTRCGKERIIVEEWIEEAQTERRANTIRHIKTSCPDPECQKIVDQNLVKEKQKNDERKAEKLESERVQKEERQKRMEQLLLQKPNNKKKQA